MNQPTIEELRNRFPQKFQIVVFAMFWLEVNSFSIRQRERFSNIIDISDAGVDINHFQACFGSCHQSNVLHHKEITKASCSNSTDLLFRHILESTMRQFHQRGNHVRAAHQRVLQNSPGDGMNINKACKRSISYLAHQEVLGSPLHVLFCVTNSFTQWQRIHRLVNFGNQGGSKATRNDACSIFRI